jgi:hypothetical protein
MERSGLVRFRLNWSGLVRIGQDWSGLVRIGQDVPELVEIVRDLLCYLDSTYYPERTERHVCHQPRFS